MIVSALEARKAAAETLRKYEEGLVGDILRHITAATAKPRVLSVDITLDSDECEKYEILRARGFGITPSWDVFSEKNISTARFTVDWR